MPEAPRREILVGGVPLKGVESGGLAGTIEVISSMPYPRQKWEYTNTSRLIYAGYNKNQSATTTDTDWIITKYAHASNTATAMPIDSQTLVGSWATHTSLAWDI